MGVLKKVCTLILEERLALDWVGAGKGTGLWDAADAEDLAVISSSTSAAVTPGADRSLCLKITEPKELNVKSSTTMVIGFNLPYAKHLPAMLVDKSGDCVRGADVLANTVMLIVSSLQLTGGGAGGCFDETSIGLIRK